MFIGRVENFLTNRAILCEVAIVHACVVVQFSGSFGRSVSSWICCGASSRINGGSGSGSGRSYV